MNVGAWETALPRFFFVVFLLVWLFAPPLTQAKLLHDK